MSKLSRNDPCHCGSGKKYKKCCLPLESAAQQVMAPVNEMLEQAMAGQMFESLGDAQVFIDHKMAGFNERPQDDFYGLSANQVELMIGAPLEDQELIGWQDDIDKQTALNTPIMRIYQLLIEQLAEPVKATAKGNLPAKIVKYIYSQMIPLMPYTGRSFGRDIINKEDDFGALHIVKILAKETGLIKYQKQHYSLTQRAGKLNAVQVYQRLYDYYVTQFNWGYEDGYPEAGFFMRTTNFSLWQLQQLQTKNKISALTSDGFAAHIIKSFPAVEFDFEQDTNQYHSAHERAILAYEVRLLSRFWQFFGLVEIVQARYDEPNTMTITPAFNQIFWFKPARSVA